MQVVFGIARNNGKFLVCKRLQCLPYPGLWEFPMEVVDDEETLEDALERGFFERTNTLPKDEKAIGAFDFDEISDCRMFGYEFLVANRKISINGYVCYKWLSSKELCRYRFTPSTKKIIKKFTFCV